jgi:3-phenylpropionate/cinnamic acid dioxygenase small subunit
VSDALRALVDRTEIAELLHRYAWMVDRKQWQMIDEVFASGATVDYTSSGGQKGGYRETLAWLARALEPWPLNLHFISNLTVALDGDRARTRCYFQAPMGRVNPDGTQHFMTNAGWYEDELVRTERGWRISARVCVQPILIGGLPEGYEIPR